MNIKQLPIIPIHGHDQPCWLVLVTALYYDTVGVTADVKANTGAKAVTTGVTPGGAIGVTSREAAGQSSQQTEAQQAANAADIVTLCDDLDTDSDSIKQVRMHTHHSAAQQAAKLPKSLLGESSDMHFHISIFVIGSCLYYVGNMPCALCKLTDFH